MKKQPLQLAILVAVVVVLAAALFGIKHYNDAQEQAADTVDTELIVDIDSDDIIRFSYEYDGQTYAFEKEDGTWYYVDDSTLNMNQTLISSMILKLAKLEVVQSVENVTDMSQYGLDKDYLTFEYETADKSYILHIGSRNSVTGVYYMAMPSETTVYMTEYYSLLGSFERTPEDLEVSEETDETEVSEETDETAASEETAETGETETSETEVTEEAEFSTETNETAASEETAETEESENAEETAETASE